MFYYFIMFKFFSFYSSMKTSQQDSQNVIFGIAIVCTILSILFTAISLVLSIHNMKTPQQELDELYKDDPSNYEYSWQYFNNQ